MVLFDDKRAPVIAAQPPDAATLYALARRIQRLMPSRHDPEAFHIEKSELADALRHLARALEAGTCTR